MSDIAGIAAKIASSGAIQTQDDRVMGETNLQGADHAKIEKAAQDFESVLLSHWLDQAEKSFATVPGADPEEDEDADPGHDQFQGLGMQALAGALTKSGGIGIAKMIVRQLERGTDTKAAVPSPVRSDEKEKG